MLSTITFTVTQESVEIQMSKDHNMVCCYPAIHDVIDF